MPTPHSPREIALLPLPQLPLPVVVVLLLLCTFMALHDEQQLVENAAASSCLQPLQKMDCISDHNPGGGFVWPSFNGKTIPNPYLQQQQQQQESFTSNAAARVPIGVPVWAWLAENQRREEDHFILQQAQGWSLSMQRLRNKHAVNTVKLIEAEVEACLRRMEEVSAKLESRMVELQELSRKWEMNSMTWKKIAKEREAEAVGLWQKLQERVRQGNCCHDDTAAVGDEYSRCYSCPLPPNEELWGCRWCHSRDSCVLFLPCRHLPACAACAESLTVCPICSETKQGSVEVLISF